MANGTTTSIRVKRSKSVVYFGADPKSKEKLRRYVRRITIERSTDEVLTIRWHLIKSDWDPATDRFMGSTSEATGFPASSGFVLANGSSDSREWGREAEADD